MFLIYKGFHIKLMNNLLHKLRKFFIDKILYTNFTIYIFQNSILLFILTTDNVKHVHHIVNLIKFESLYNISKC